MYSLRRTLGVRFSLTMLAALMLIGMGVGFCLKRLEPTPAAHKTLP